MPERRPIWVHEQPTSGVIDVHSGVDDRLVTYVAAERHDALRDAVQAVLDLRSSYDADQGRDVKLVGNLQAREILQRALENSRA